MNDDKNTVGVITEQGDLGLGFEPIKEDVDIKEKILIRRTKDKEK